MNRSLFAVGSAMVAVLCISADGAGQQASLTGRVVDGETNQPVSAAQVHIPTLDIGVLSAVSGTFQLANVPPGEHTVFVERLGWRTVTQTVTVTAGQTVELNFELVRQALALDEIVATGTAGGTQRRALGTVVERMDLNQLSQIAPPMDFENAIGTRVPGVILHEGAGLAGGGGKIRIRGSSSLTIPGDPLIYINGIRVDTEPTIAQRDESIGRLNDINPADIESIEILKGPAASTLYGTEASNGVIQITTRRGTEGPATFEVSAEYGNSFIPNLHEKMTPVCYFPHKRGEPIPADALETGYLEEIPGQGTLFCYTFDKSVPREQYWGRDLFRYGQILKTNISVQGGNPTFRYLASFNRSNIDGITYRDWNKSTSGRVALFFSAHETLSFNVNGSILDSGTRNPTNVWRNMTSARSVNYNGSTGGLRDFAWEAAVVGRRNIISLNRSTWSIEANHTPTGWLTNRMVFGIDRGDHREDQITYKNPDGIGYVGPQFGRRGREGEKTVFQREAPIRTLDVASSATLPLTEQLTATTSAGLQYYNQTNRTYRLVGENFATAALTTCSAAAICEGDESFLENTSLGVYIQEQFDWEGRVFVTGAIRADDNSSFGQDFDIATYPKLSATWVLSEEPFWSYDFISTMRLRGAWGASGAQPDLFAGTTLYTGVTAAGGEPAFTPEGLGNPDLGPERGEEFEVGFDSGFWDERAQLQFTYYSRSTKDAIIARPVLESRGYPGTQFLNIGQVDAWGTETSLNVQILDQDPLFWNLNIAFATMGNEIVDMGGEQVLPVGSSRSQRHVEGFPVAGFHDIKVLSAEFANPTQGFGPVNTDTWLCDGGRGPGNRLQGGPAVPCEDAPRVYFGQPEPSWTVNIASSWTLFESWQIYSSFDVRGGMMRAFDLLGALHNRSSRANQVQDDPLFMAYSLLSRSPVTHHDNGFARWRELSLRYEIPTTVVERLLFGAQRASILVGAHNVALLWWEQPYTAFGRTTDGKSGERAVDPEFNTAQDDWVGETRGGMPVISDISIRLNATF